MIDREIADLLAGPPFLVWETVGLLAGHSLLSLGAELYDINTGLLASRPF